MIELSPLAKEWLLEVARVGRTRRVRMGLEGNEGYRSVVFEGWRD